MPCQVGHKVFNVMVYAGIEEEKSMIFRKSPTGRTCFSAYRLYSTIHPAHYTQHLNDTTDSFHCFPYKPTKTFFMYQIKNLNVFKPCVYSHNVWDRALKPK